MGRGDPTGVSCFASCGQTFGSGGDLREKTLLRVLLPGTEVVVWLLVLLKCFQFTIYIYICMYVCMYICIHADTYIGVVQKSHYFKVPSLTKEFYMVCVTMLVFLLPPLAGYFMVLHVA